VGYLPEAQVVVRWWRTIAGHAGVPGDPQGGVDQASSYSGFRHAVEPDAALQTQESLQNQDFAQPWPPGGRGGRQAPQRVISAGAWAEGARWPL
jgi:hypothetical protein